MDAEPFVPTPEKMGAGGAASDGFTGFKRNLFTVSALKDAGVQKVLRQQQENRSSDSDNATQLAAELGQKGFKEIQKANDHPLQRDSRERRPSNDSVELQLMGHSERPFARVGSGSTGEPETTEDAGSRPAGTRASKQQHARNNAQNGTTPPAPTGRASESVNLHTPLKAKRPDTDNVLFTPPPAPGFRRPSISSSPITPLPDALRDAPGQRILKKSSARLKELSMQLKEAGRDSQDGATSTNVETTPESSAASPACDTPAPHPYALLASALPAEDLMADPKYRGMAALGCQHQYTDADRASFLRRREFVARDLNSAFAA